MPWPPPVSTYSTSNLLVVEGARGLPVPISGDDSMADLEKNLEMQVVIVAADRLGAINHTLLAIEAARNRSLKIAAVVLNQGEHRAGRGLENAHTISVYGRVPTFGFPHARGRPQLLEHGKKPLDRRAQTMTEDGEF
ncbi:MAG: dethiobiotin synthase [Myxococcales bacterium]|nr:dethiobiotin synthase [Myxococcales bacterium]